MKIGAFFMDYNNDNDDSEINLEKYILLLNIKDYQIETRIFQDSDVIQYLLLDKHGHEVAFNAYNKYTAHNYENFISMCYYRNIK